MTKASSTLHLSIQLAEKPQPTANDARGAAEPQEHVEALTSKFGNGAKTVLIGNIISDKDRTATNKWRNAHQRLDCASLGDGSRPNFNGHLALQNLKLGLVPFDQCFAQPPTNVFCFRRAAIVSDHCMALALN